MFILSLLDAPLVAIVVLLSLLIAFTIHEFAHAFIAEHLGDPTARMDGRLSLNPLKHLDPLGTIALLMTGFGWGKPVPFDPYNLKNPRRDSALIALAGPASNLIIAVVFAIIAAIPGVPVLIQAMLYPAIFLNLNLAIFNLIPIHPLDGGKIAIGFLPKNIAYQWQETLNKYGTLLLILFVFPFSSQGSAAVMIISPIVDFLLRFLIRQ